MDSVVDLEVRISALRAKQEKVRRLRSRALAGGAGIRRKPELEPEPEPEPWPQPEPQPGRTLETLPEEPPPPLPLPPPQQQQQQQQHQQQQHQQERSAGGPAAVADTSAKPAGTSNLGLGFRGNGDDVKNKRREVTMVKGTSGFGMKVGRRANVTEVDAGLPAADAGIVAGDQIVSIDGVPVWTHEEVRTQLATLRKAGQTVVIILRKDFGQYNGAEKLSRAQLQKRWKKETLAGQLGICGSSPSREWERTQHRIDRDKQFIKIAQIKNPKLSRSPKVATAKEPNNMCFSPPAKR